MRAERYYKNSVDLTLALLEYLESRDYLSEKELKEFIKQYYSHNVNTINAHLKLLKRLSFIGHIKVQKLYYYTFLRGK